MHIAKETILRRIKTALRDVLQAEQPADVTVAREYIHTDTAPHPAQVHQFAERVAEYKARVQIIVEPELAAAITAALNTHSIARLVIPADLPEAWVPQGVTLLRDHSQLTTAELDNSDGVLTGCALGIAQTGTIVLDHSEGQGRRAISLVPDYHLCIVQAEQIVGVMPEAITKLEAAARAGQPLTFISGPSATSDIELSRVEGVHGPRTLDVLIIQAA